MKDLRQTKEYADYLRRIGWTVLSTGQSNSGRERKVNVNYAIKRLPLIGISVLKIQRPEKLNYQFIDELVKKYRVFQIIIEPKNKKHEERIMNKGFKISRSPYLPSKTVQIDLTKSQDQLLKEMHYKTRYNIRKTQNSKLKTQNTKNINLFADFWQENAMKQRGMFLSMKKEIKAIYSSFKKDAIILIAKKGRELLAGILLIIANKTAYYMYAASSSESKKLFAPTLVTWESIKLAKKLGCKIYDFEGIYDERFPLKGWKGFSRFKKSFGGAEIVYPGAYVKMRLPL